MSRIVNVDGDYKVSVTSGNTITLDTGVEAGKTVVTGDLEVKGTTQTISSINTTTVSYTHLTLPTKRIV